MSETMAMTIHVSPETREYIRKKVEDGEYASEGELIDHAIYLARDDDEELRQWELENVIKAKDEMDADPLSGISVEELRINLELARRERLASLSS